MPIEKPSEYTIPCDNFVKGDYVVIEQHVEKPYGDAPKTWWRCGHVLKVNHEQFWIETLAATTIIMKTDVIAFRKPWADETVRNVFKRLDQKKRHKLRTSTGDRREIGRLKLSNRDKERIDWT